MTGLTCTVCGDEFIFDDIMSSDAPMCEKCAEEEWQKLIIKHDEHVFERVLFNRQFNYSYFYD